MLELVSLPGSLLLRSLGQAVFEVGTSGSSSSACGMEMSSIATFAGLTCSAAAIASRSAFTTDRDASKEPKGDTRNASVAFQTRCMSTGVVKILVLPSPALVVSTAACEMLVLVAKSFRAQWVLRQSGPHKSPTSKCRLTVDKPATCAEAFPEHPPAPSSSTKQSVMRPPDATLRTSFCISWHCSFTHVAYTRRPAAS